eukprot:TRINITY_DN24146_c0_g1_i1.p1 TRINITY_DN24146_c0_g1~~TRINITY_DN24146_c0_g1_i1.p1  ORF type:complete len:408 (-),score=109.82 TRINITY_DN24146_c0_g1_i1:322-1545(-)
MSDEQVDGEEKKELDLTSPDVVTKYKNAAEIANKVLAAVIGGCKPGAKIVQLCEKGDAMITDLCGNVFKNAKKKIDRGVAFPTCISVNNIVCHVSPMPGDEAALAEGDVVKIDLGIHIDGFIATVAHTVFIGGEEDTVKGRAADVIAAASQGAEVALRLVRPGKKNKDVTEALQKVAAQYDCRVVEGVLSHQMKQFVIDGNKVVLSSSTNEMRVDDFVFEENEVYSVDVVMSTGEGKPKLLDERETTIFKRAIDRNYSLKMRASRTIFSEINSKFAVMPFTARSLDEVRGARLGLVECVNHELLQPYPVLHEKPGDLVAHFKFTVLLMPNGSDKITGATVQALSPATFVEDAEVKAFLALGVKSKKKGGGKKKKGKKTGGEEEGEEAAGEEEGDAAKPMEISRPGEQ